MTFWWRYIDTWNETDSSRRSVLAELVLLDGARYTDLMMSSTGPKGFAEMIGVFQAQMPGLKFERVGGIDATGVMVRFSWRLVDAGGRQLASGTDVGEFSIDGRFAGITGFLDSTLIGPAWCVEKKYAAFWVAPDFSRPSDELASDIEGYWPGLQASLKGVEAYVRPLHELLRRVPDFRLEVADYASRGDKGLHPLDYHGDARRCTVALRRRGLRPPQQWPGL